MRNLTAETVSGVVAEYSGLPESELRARELGGGVSNRVWLVEGGGARLVLKQALPKLRVKEDWFSDPSRIHREAEALRRLTPFLPPGSIPRVLFEDREQYFYAMEAAAVEQTWKDLLLAGDANEAIAIRIAEIQAAMMTATWHQPEFADSFGDLNAFDQLRVDPYYRFTASRYPEYRSAFDAAIDRAVHERHCLVHGDWSPKNMMVNGEHVMAIDFEVIHYGDPAFDCGFLLNHLLLKSVHRRESRATYRRAAAAYWNRLSEISPANDGWLLNGVLVHLRCLLLARVDGKSPAEYLKEPLEREDVRRLAGSLMKTQARDVAEIFERMDR